ncbi:MAG: hypothetical protein ACYCPS_01970 [Candidatus Saccharimonadales bacterium]
MQPNQPYMQPQPTAPQPVMPPQQPAPDYNFIYQQSQKKRRLPTLGNSLPVKIVFILLGLLVLVILFIIIKGIISPASFSHSDYYVVVERQYEMIHILTVDVTNTNISQLSNADQNFVATATLSLQTAAGKTLTFMSDNGYKVNLTQLAKAYNVSVDQQLSNSLQSNSFDSEFQSQFRTQLTYYQQELSAAYSSTKISSGRDLLASEYQEAKLLLTALSSANS